MIRRIFTTFLLLLPVLLGQAQQQAMYTQYMFNTLAINPAYAAVDESMTMTVLSRHQWVGFKGAPQTQTMSFHTPIKESNSFIGALLINDQIGEVLQETGGYITFSQRVEMADGAYLSLGVNGGLSSFRADYSRNFDISPESMNDPQFYNSSSLRGNFGVGVMYFTEKAYIGISSPHFLARDFTSFSKDASSPKVKPHYMFQAGSLFEFSYDYKFKPNVLVKYVNGSPMQVDLNANLLIKELFWIGASYRSFESFDALASVFITPDIQFGYSYDFSTTEMSKTQKGSHEIMLKFRMPVKGRDHRACYW
ncbi:type IX secretion system membrane protein PorP/SprF [Pedobacter sp. SYSU D00535]|uniref:PorP/SprF family type IX secretion system membrane protein n=1 Tax=Pedobacter sp. SYSU D00535 TaxID=2810308 RepID=UPI001A96F49D|nr:type IX secretion system membrane protein PorP/SprF [Pedobacter sp. SYSU D00535]